MIFKWKTRHKSIKHGRITGGSRNGSMTPTTSKALQIAAAAAVLETIVTKNSTPLQTYLVKWNN